MGSIKKMGSVFKICFFFSLFLSTLSGYKIPSGRIKNVVTIMMENRSFDHMLGHLKKLNPDIDGLNGNESNPIDPTDPKSPEVKISFDAPWLIGMNPGHSYQSTAEELWGSQKRVDPATMNGFIKELWGDDKTLIDWAKGVMRCYNESTLPGMSTLAQEFAIFDHWFASVPACTDPNRMYLYSCTSLGAADNILDYLIEGYPQRTIYDDIYDSDFDFKIYFSDFPISLIMTRVREYPLHIRLWDEFLDNAKAGTLPTYSYLEPQWFDLLEWKENDDHPPASTLYGEFLFKEIYEALRNSPQWNDTLWIIIFDEHGGLYDHVPPPQHDVPNPDGVNSTNPDFDFTRLGVRIPALMISPWIKKGTVYHEPAKNHFDHTSVIGTLRKMFPLQQGPLTHREAWSGTFEDVVEILDSPRTDCPETIPVPKGTEHLYEAYRKARSLRVTPENIKNMLKTINLQGYMEDSPLANELQLRIAQIAWGLTGGVEDMSKVRTEYDAAVFVRKQMNTYFAKHNLDLPFPGIDLLP